MFQRLADEIKVTKNTYVHAKIAQYLYQMLCLYPYEGVLELKADVIKSFL